MRCFSSVALEKTPRERFAASCSAAEAMKLVPYVGAALNTATDGRAEASLLVGRNGEAHSADAARQSDDRHSRRLAAAECASLFRPTTGTDAMWGGVHRIPPLASVS